MQVLLPTKKNIAVVANYLNQGAVVVAPTETAYGLLADATNNQAVKKIFKIKGRRLDKAVAIIVADLKMAKQYGKFSSTAEKMAKKNWPAPLTIVVPAKKYGLNKLASSILLQKMVGMRIPKHEWLRQLIKKVGKPLTATSANLTGKKNLYSFRQALSQFKNCNVSIIINGKKLSYRPVSTVVKIIGKKITVLRQGAIKI
ncbi:MAG: L-threonylcarbamoyladenylate synthase [Patescibacteria group bacterium]